MVSRDGSRTGLHVYCPGRVKALPLEECRSCARCVEVLEGGAEPRIHCTPLWDGKPAQSIGELITDELTCVRHDVLVAAVRPLVAAVLPVVVVDAVNRFVGIVRAREVLSGFGRAATMGDVAARIAPLAAASDVRRAVLHLAVSRLRLAPIVDADNAPIGVLRDTHALRWLKSAG